MQTFGLTIKPTLQCNCRCLYCYAAKQPISTMPAELLEYIFKETARYTKAHNLETISVHWHGGEPMVMGADFYRKVMKLERTYWPHLAVAHSMTSNATLYKGELRKVLREFLTDDQSLGISFDPCHPVRPFAVGGDSITAGLQGSLAIKEDGFKVRPCYVVHKKSLEVVDDVYHTFKNIGAESILFIPAERFNDPRYTEYHTSSEDWGEFLTRLWELWEEDGFGIWDVSPLSQWRDAILARGPVNNCEYGPPQDRSRPHVSIAPDGDISSCATLQDTHLFSVGNIRDMSMEQVIANEMTYIVSHKREHISAECLDCRFVSLCGSGCPGTHDDTGKTVWCKGLKNFFSYLISTGTLTDDYLQYSFQSADWIRRQLAHREGRRS